jgi:anti-sigma factor RsiW
MTGSFQPQDPSSLGGAEAADLTRAILARTSGSPCERLRAQACAFVDGELEPGRAALVGAHLEHCPACAALVETLAELQRVLPALAAPDPGPWFTQRVLRATVRAPRGEARTLWATLIRRPRICLEAAYLGLAGGMMGMLALPSLPTLNVPGLLAPALVQVQAVQRSVEPVKAPFIRMGTQAVQAGQRTRASLARCLHLGQIPAPDPPPLQRLTAWVSSWFKDLRAFFLPRPKPAKPANP